jgi:predicted NBD/HSP70 family sugar kinase
VEVAEWTGVGLRAIVNIFNPQAIVLGGVLAQVWTARNDVMTRSMSSTTLHALLEQVRVMPAALGDDSSLIGAAEMAFEGLLADPLAEFGRSQAHPA